MDDIEGIISMGALLTALSLSFLVSMQMESMPQKQMPADFRGLICSSQDFRLFIVEVMDTFRGGVGEFKEEPFNFTVSLGGGQALDLRKELETEIHSRHGEVSARAALPSCFRDPDVGITSEVLASVFPMHMMTAWVIKHDPPVMASDGVELTQSMAFGLMWSCLLLSIALYVSLASSGSRDNEKELAGWLRVGWWGIVLTYLLFFAAMVCFLIGYSRMLQWNSPLFKQTFRNVSIIGIGAVTAPLTVLGVGVSVAAWFTSSRSRKSARPAAADEVVTTPRSMEVLV